MSTDHHSFIPIAVDPHSKAILEMAEKAANSQATLLISGETGVGKELIARYIHEHSSMKSGPFVSINCAALPENMIESILFGYEKGAFTSSINQYIGKFEQAEGGTLLLDEISEIPLALQAKLLRVLQEREIERLGGKKIIPVHVRVIAATNRDLLEEVTRGTFRKDLYYRLSVIPIHCPPLRARTLDIIPLAEYFLHHHAAALNRHPPILTERAKRKLMTYSWPGNIREMDNVMQRILVMNNNHEISDKDIDLNEEVSQNSEAMLTHLMIKDSKLKVNEAKTIIEVLHQTDGCRGEAAKKLNMSPRTLRYKISKLKSIGLKVP